MILEEKLRLLSLLDRESRWCQHAEAQDAGSNPVHCDDAAAEAWDITGAIIHLFGDERASVLFVQLDRHVNGKRSSFGWPPRNSAMDAMVALQDFNDRLDTTFATLRAQLETAPVWTAGTRAATRESEVTRASDGGEESGTNH